MYHFGRSNRTYQGKKNINLEAVVQRCSLSQTKYIISALKILNLEIAAVYSKIQISSLRS